MRAPISPPPSRKATALCVATLSVDRAGGPVCARWLTRRGVNARRRVRAPATLITFLGGCPDQLVLVGDGDHPAGSQLALLTSWDLDGPQLAALERRLVLLKSFPAGLTSPTVIWIALA